jgi:hypothetical protein
MKRLLLITSLCVLFASSIAFADWDPGDPHKMHFPQLPDPTGWDVAFNSPGVANQTLADDWQCSQTGPVDDIHFWISVQQWTSPAPVVPVLQPFRVGIRADVPAGTIPGIDYSTPGDLLWTKDIDPLDPTYNIRWYGTGDQGWYDPWAGTTNLNDHTEFFQINLTGLGTAANPAFIQNEGNIYWLEIGMLPAPDGHEIGWKTADLDSYPAPLTGQHFMDDAVYGTTGAWKELYYPNTTPPESLDLAFVITPEPATIMMLGLGSLTLLRRRRKK